MNKEELWQAVLAQIQFNISPANFATWFKKTGVLSKKDNEVIISVPNNFSKEWLENKYNKTLLNILHNLDQEIKEIKYKVIHSNLKIKPQENNLIEAEVDQLEFPEFKNDKETNLNPRYLFENFIIGSFNELSHAAASAVTKNPGLVYNPLFVYGGTGLGKTHLLQAIGNEVQKNFPKKKVKYLSSEKFTSEVVNAIKNRTIEKLKSLYRGIDVLIIDDIQFLAGKEKTQEEFFHTFNALYDKNKQIILSSDRPPTALPSMEERLKSRFEGGMITDISLPDFETRLAILKTKMQEKKINFSEDVLEFIASHIKKNIRELEGALNRLMVYQKLNHKSPDIETAKTLFKTTILNSIKVATSKKIIQAVIEFYDLKEKELFSNSRRREIIKPRQIAMYFFREELKSSFPYIGRKFNGKDHTTVIHACNKISKEIEKNKKIEEEINLIKDRIYTI
jgi:chromosomal replication initiator protein